MNQQLVISSVDELPHAAAQLLTYCTDKKIFAFLGGMGAGKTTVIAAICKVLGVNQHISSPTFAIVNEYSAHGKIFHLDLFRLKTIEEAVEIGIEEYLTGDDYCFIEWPQLIEPLLPVETVYVTIEVLNDQERILNIAC